MKIRERLKNSYRPFMTLAVRLLIGMSVWGEFRRNAAVKELKQELNYLVAVNRRMLNARAQIQQILIKATIEDRRLTAEEVDTIGRLWAAAEYDQTKDIQINPDGIDLK